MQQALILLSLLVFICLLNKFDKVSALIFPKLQRIFLVFVNIISQSVKHSHGIILKGNFCLCSLSSPFYLLTGHPLIMLELFNQTILRSLQLVNLRLFFIQKINDFI